MLYTMINDIEDEKDELQDDDVLNDELMLRYNKCL